MRFICHNCGDGFESNYTRAKYCKKILNSKCEFCGKLFFQKCDKRIVKVCSKECRLKLVANKNSKLAKAYQPIQLENESIEYPTERGFIGNCKFCGTLTWFPNKKYNNCGITKYIVNCKTCGKDIINYCGGKQKQYCNNTCFYKDVGNRRNEGMMKKYGTTNIRDIPKASKKRDETMLKRYGNVEYLSSEIGKEKIKNIFLEKYGHISPLRNKEIQKQIKQYYLDNYGIDNVAKLQETTEKRIKTIQEKYGVDNVIQNKKICKKKVESTDKVMEQLQIKRRNTLFEKTGYRENFADPRCRKKIAETNREKYGTAYPIVTNSNRQVVSKINKNIKKWIETEFNFTVEFEKPISDNYIADLYIVEKDLYIDYNPTVTHNSTFPFACLRNGCDSNCIRHLDKIIPKNYHLNKSLKAKKNNKNYIQIFEWENWKERIENFINLKINMINSENRIYVDWSECSLNKIPGIDYKIYEEIKEYIPIPYMIYHYNKKEHIQNYTKLDNSKSVIVYTPGVRVFIKKEVICET